MKSNIVLFIVVISIFILVGISFPHNMREGLTSKSKYYCDTSKPGSANCIAVHNKASSATKNPVYPDLNTCKKHCKNPSGHGGNGHGGNGHGGNGHGGNGHSSHTKNIDNLGNVTFICENTMDDSGNHHQSHPHGQPTHHPTNTTVDSFVAQPGSCGNGC